MFHENVKINLEVICQIKAHCNTRQLFYVFME